MAPMLAALAALLLLRPTDCSGSAPQGGARPGALGAAARRFLPPSSGRDFPHPLRQPARCGLGARGCLEGALLCDPSGLLNASPGGGQLERALASLGAFREELGPHLGGWGASVGVAVLDLAAGPLPELAAEVAQAWGLAGARGALLVLQAGGRPAAALAGGLVASARAGSAASGAWVGDAERAAEALLRAGRLADAAEAGLALVAAAAAGVPAALELPGLSGRTFAQTMLEDWTSDFQSGEIWENICAGSRCLELFLGEASGKVRQISDYFEPYYHEALTFPALNLLGAEATRVLVLGGGDGGVATHVLKYGHVAAVVNVDIDATVTKAARKWFPAVSASLNDPRFEMIHGDAFTWVQEAQGQRLFDLIILDFTDEPLEGAWSNAFFASLKGLLRPGGAVVHNIGTMLTPGTVRRLFKLYGTAFQKVWPMSAQIPDYAAPYILFLSSDSLEPFFPDWSFWEAQGISARYYSPDVHNALFAPPADLAQLLGIMPDKARNQETIPGQVTDKVLVDKETAHGSLVVQQSDCVCYSKGNPCVTIQHDREMVLTCFTAYRDEVMIMPAMNLLGEQARRVLLLGGGTGGLVAQAVKFPALERLVMVEIEPDVVAAARKHIPGHDAALADPRVEIVFEDALRWLGRDTGQFDLVVVNLVDAYWRPASQTTRVPRTLGFVRALRDAVAPNGIVVQEVGTVQTPLEALRKLDLHRAVFGSVWPMTGSALDNDLLTSDELDGRFRRPPHLFAMSSPRPDLLPASDLSVDWARWEAADVDTLYYHRGVHRALFALPAELRRLLEAPAPPAEATSAGAELVQSLSIEVRGCDEGLLNDTAAAEGLLSRLAGMGALSELGKISHQFSPQGVTALMLVSESHVGIHTWPELGFAVLDVVSCKIVPPQTLRAMAEAAEATLRCKAGSWETRYRGHGLGGTDAAEAQVSAAGGRDEL